MCKIILIGMPASGKSTVGKILAARYKITFTDGDDLIRAYMGSPLDAVIRKLGTEGFLALEEEILTKFSPEGVFVFASGGSAVYSERAMAHLKEIGTVVYLNTPCRDIAARIPDFAARGVVMRGKLRTLEELYEERAPLYETYADLTVDCENLTVEETAQRIAAAFRKEDI